jgi:hypothetical protein
MEVDSDGWVAASACSTPGVPAWLRNAGEERKKAGQRLAETMAF